jgi:hypothetical protein
VLLISHALWLSQFAASRSVLRRTLSLSGKLYTVIGVMPPTFRFPVDQPKDSFWTTIAADDDPRDLHPLVTNRSAHFLTVMGRLKPGVTVAQADQEMKTLAAQLATLKGQTE